MIGVDESVRLVILQFNFSNPDAIPVTVKQLGRETTAEHQERKGHGNGVMVITPTENCSIEQFLEELEGEYQMVDAFSKERIDNKDPRGNRTYYIVRFTFVRHEHVAQLSEEFLRIRDTIRQELREMCRVAMWRVRTFLNPFFRDGLKVDNTYAVSINLDARKPLFGPDSQRIMVWQKDEQGNKIGSSPILLQASRFLRMDGQVVHLT